MENLIILEETDSTNTYIKNLIVSSGHSPAPGTAVWAKRQTCGRGRLGRSFVSPEGGIYLSIVLLPFETMTITAKAAVAVCRTLKKKCNVDAGIKWVNDVYINGRKVCGILAEFFHDTVILGIGLNYTTDISLLGDEVSQTATSVYTKQQKGICPAEEIVRSLISETVSLCLSDSMSFLEEYRSADILKGKQIRILQAGNETLSGIADGIDDSCALIVLSENGRTTISTGEASVRMK